MSILKFTNKNTEETEFFTFDFTDLLAQNSDSIVSVGSVTITDSEAPPPSADKTDEMLVDSPNLVGDLVVLKVTGGDPGNRYILSCTVETTLEQTLTGEGTLFINKV